jgi:hypothetical protein
MGATEEEAVGSSREAVDLSISGLTIMLDGWSVSSDEKVAVREAPQNEIMLRKGRSCGSEKRGKAEGRSSARQRVGRTT